MQKEIEVIFFGLFYDSVRYSSILDLTQTFLSIHIFGIEQNLSLCYIFMGPVVRSEVF